MLTVALILAIGQATIEPVALDFHTPSGLAFRLHVGKGCSVDHLRLKGRQVDDDAKGLTTGVQVGGQWFTSKDAPNALITYDQHAVKVSGIEFGGGGVRVREQWTFTTGKDSVDWKIDRKYLSAGKVDDVAMPSLTFRDLTTWTGAVLGTGGVAWCKLFDLPSATYGIHTNSARFWNPGFGGSLRVDAFGAQALRFTREPGLQFSMTSQVTQHPLVPKLNKARFRRDSSQIWQEFSVVAGESESTTLRLRCEDFKSVFGRGEFKGLDTAAVTELLNTIGRIGVVDGNLIGSNGWYSGYVCLHEPWHGLTGIALDDPNYTRSYAKALDFERDHAVQADGMVKSRWYYDAGDAAPGTYDAFGFYEAQWGRLMDSQPSYVLDVADEFDLNGDLNWVRGQKRVCESALDYLLKRDTDGNHLVEMENDSLTQKRSSDWLDICWASYENALVNGQLYAALVKWADVERLLGDDRRCAYYLDFAAKLKVAFNRTTYQGGFWDEAKGCYAYWRERDGAVHGTNWVTHVNLTALGEGLCDDPVRRKRLLDGLEKKMLAEHLLSWPSCLQPFADGECANKNWPEYENGDIFLAWAELGIRSYASDQPSVALKYVRQIVNQYKKDGLAFQRYLRADGKGAGDDILSNNCNAMVGLYRDIYGIQPKYNRLYLAPHLTHELDGTVVNYLLRGRALKIGLSVRRFSVASGGLKVSSGSPFGVDFGSSGVSFFAGDSAVPAFSLAGVGLDVAVLEWGERRRLAVSSGKVGLVSLRVFGLGVTDRFRVGGAVVTGANPVARVVLKAGKNMLELVRVR